MSGFKSLLGRQSEIASKRLVVGFDGFVDTIVRPIRQTATEDTPAQMFGTIREFGEFLVSRAGKSCSIEINIDAKQLGGNLPFLSQGAGKLGLDVVCIGMLGEGGVIEPEFAGMPGTLYSFAPSGQSTCFEFQDGKVLFASDCTLSGDPWQTVLSVTGGKAPALFRDADLIAMVNWSELSFSQGLWESAYQASLLGEACDKERFAFFDLCDCTRRTDGEIEGVLRLMGRFSAQRTTILSVNENEAHVIASRVLGCGNDPAVIGQALRDRYGIDEVLVHTIYESLLATERGLTRQLTDFVKHPKISTGAGDNFNAASCFGAVMGMSDLERVSFANRYASFYVSNGYSATLDEIVV